MYSVEEEEKQKSEEKPDEEPNKEVVDDKADEDVYEKVKEEELVKKEKIAWKEDDFETTEYDCSTDDDSFRMIYSSTDQVQLICVTSLRFIKCLFKDFSQVSNMKLQLFALAVFEIFNSITFAWIKKF